MDGNSYYQTISCIHIKNQMSGTIIDMFLLSFRSFFPSGNYKYSPNMTHYALCMNGLSVDLTLEVE